LMDKDSTLFLETKEMLISKVRELDEKFGPGEVVLECYGQETFNVVYAALKTLNPTATKLQSQRICTTTLWGREIAVIGWLTMGDHKEGDIEWYYPKKTVKISECCETTFKKRTVNNGNYPFREHICNRCKEPCKIIEVKQ